MPDQKTANVIGIVFALALVILGVQSCNQSSTRIKPVDQDILAVGRMRLMDSFTDDSQVEVTHEMVIRPGRYGGEFGYWARYTYPGPEGSIIEEEHYDE